MTARHYENAENVVLADYIPSDHFRTILYADRKIPCGLTEIPVELELNEKFIKRLSFPIKGTGSIYGFVRRNAILKGLDSSGTENQIKSISLHDWDNQFVLIFERQDGKENPVFYVESEEVQALLENCLRVPEQKSTK